VNVRAVVGFEITFTGDVAVVGIPLETPACETLLLLPLDSPPGRDSEKLDDARDRAFGELREARLRADEDCDIPGVLVALSGMLPLPGLP